MKNDFLGNEITPVKNSKPILIPLKHLGEKYPENEFFKWSKSLFQNFDFSNLFLSR